jgi:hypothetical protein
VTEKLDIAVTYDERSGGYVGTVPGLRSPVVALSLGGLRRQVEAALMPDAVILQLRLDRAAARERDTRRSRQQQMAGGRERACVVHDCCVSDSATG